MGFAGALEPRGVIADWPTSSLLRPDVALFVPFSALRRSLRSFGKAFEMPPLKWFELGFEANFLHAPPPNHALWLCYGYTHEYMNILMSNDLYSNHEYEYKPPIVFIS